MSNNLPYFRQYQAHLDAAARMQALGASSRPEQFQPQPQPQPGARLDGTAQNSRSMAYQSYQLLYPLQLHPQVQSQPPVRTQPQYQATGSSITHDARPNLPDILGQFIESLNQLRNQQQHVNESLAKSDKCLEILVSSVSSIRETADGLTKKLEAHDGVLEKLEQSSRSEDKAKAKAKEIDVMKILVGEMKAFKKTLGKSCGGDDGRTVLGRLDDVTFAVGELLERARDPEANLPKPSASTTVPPIIDLTMSLSPSPPPVRRASPVRSHSYVDVGTSSVLSPSPLKEKSFASIQVGTSPRPSSDPFGSFLQSPAESIPYTGRFSPAHTLVDDTTTSPDMKFAALTRKKLESPIPTDVHPMDPTALTLDSQICPSSTITNNSEDATQIQPKSQLSDNTIVTTAKALRVETITALHPVMYSGSASPSVQPPQNFAGLDGSVHKSNRLSHDHNTGLLHVTPGPRLGVLTFKRPDTSASASASSSFASSASTSSASPVFTPTPFTQMEVQRPVDKTVAALRASATRVKNPYLGVVNSSVREDEQQQKEKQPLPLSQQVQQKEYSQKQGLPERLESLLSIRGDTLSLDNMNSESLTVGADGMSHNENKIRTAKRALDEERKDKREEIKRIEKQVFELNEKRNGDVPGPVGLIDLTQYLRGRRSSSFRFGVSPSPSTSLSSSGRAGSKPGIDSSEDVSVPSRLPLNATNVLVGAAAGHLPVSVVHAAAAPPTTPASVTASNSTRIPATTPIKKAASVISSRSALQPIMTDTRLKIFTPAAPESNFAWALAFEKSRPPSQTSALPAAASAGITNSPAIDTITPAKNLTPAASSCLDPLASPAALFDKPLLPSQASSSTTANEVSVSRMVIEREDENGEGEGENVAEETSEKIELKTAKRNFEEEEEEEEEAKLRDHFLLPSPSLSLSPPLLTSISGSPHLRPTKVFITPTQSSVPSTPRPRSDLSFTLLSHSPLAAAATSKNQTQIGKTPEADNVFSSSSFSSVTCTPQPQSQSQLQSQMRNASLASPPPLPARFTHVRTPSSTQPDVPRPPSPLVAVVSSSCSPTTMNLENDRLGQRHSQIQISIEAQDDGKSRDEAIEKPVEENDEDEEIDELDQSLEHEEHEDHNPLELQSPLFISSATNNFSVEKREEEGDEEEGVALKLKSPMSSRRGQFITLSPSDQEGGSIGTTDIAKGATPDTITTPSTVTSLASTQMQTQTQTRTSIKVLLPRDLSPISDVVKEKGKAKETDRMQVSDDFPRKRYTSLGDDADIARAKKRRVSEGSGTADHVRMSSPVAKGKNVRKEEMNNSKVVEIKSGKIGADVKNPSLLNLKAGKGESVAVTRVKKRKDRSHFVMQGEAEGEEEADDGLDQERPLKRARQRVSERQMMIEPLEKGKRLTREFSGSSFEAGTSTRVTKPRSTAASGSGTTVMARIMKPRSYVSTSGKVRKKTLPSKGGSSTREFEVEWPKMTKGDRSEDLVGCDGCKAWYHYGCVGITASDTRLQNGKYFCPPCKTGAIIKKPNVDTECWRPGCIVPAGYIVEKIIGRYKKFMGGQGLQFKYLLRWKGYSLSESSWEPEESMYDPPFMIEKFRLDALEEGIDIDKDKTGLILLRMAKDPCVPKPM